MRATRAPQGHRHTPPGQHEHEHEPQYGLPEALPEGETMLWQGAPDWKNLAIRRFHVRKLVVYFALLLVLRVASLMSDGQPLGPALQGSALLLLLSVLAIAMFLAIAWFTSTTTVYTLTDKRVVMRIGIVLTITLNLPLRRIEAADLNLHSGEIGDVALRLMKPDHLAYLHLWPHARPWRLRRPEPALVCVPNAAQVAAQLTAAWQAVQGSQGRVATHATASAVGDVAPQLATR